MKLFLFVICVALVALSFSDVTSAQPAIPPPPDDMVGATPPPSPPPPPTTATTTREYKNPCAGKPGTRWCAVLKECVKHSNYKEECKDTDKDEDEPDCGELGVVEEDGKKRCKTLKEVIAEVIASGKSGGPVDQNGNCVFGPFPDEGEELGDITCYTHSEAHSTLYIMLFFLFLLCLGGTAFGFFLKKRLEETRKEVEKMQKKVDTTVKDFDTFIEGVKNKS